MAVCFSETRGFYAFCDKCGKEVDFNKFLTPESNLKKLGWSFKYNYRYNRTICSNCRPKRKKKDKGLFDGQ